jgi:FkbM family methyltransferase
MKITQSLKEKIKILLYKKLGFVKRELEKTKILGQKVTVNRGSIYYKPQEDTAWILELTKGSEIIFDVGVNTGQSSILMLIANPKCNLVLVEPDHISLGVALENLVLNRLIGRVRIQPFFASDTVGKLIKFWSFYGDAAGSRFSEQASTARRNNQYMEVPSITLDKISEEYDVIPDFIKMDIEGAELEALIGCEKILKLRQTKFLIEVHAFTSELLKTSSHEMLKLFEPNGYAIYDLKEKRRIGHDYWVRNRIRYHILAIPESEDPEKKLFDIPEFGKIDNW